MLYHLYELNHAAIAPLRAAVNVNRFFLDNEINPFSETFGAKVASASFEVFDRVTRRYAKPVFGIDRVTGDDGDIEVHDEVVRRLPFCDLRHFRRAFANGSEETNNDPVVLLLAPLSGHYATLLRGTVKALVPNHEVYITDWRDAREIPLSAGTFDLDDYVHYVMRFIRELGPEVHVIAVCQPGPAAVAATALLAEDEDHATPRSLTLIGSPIDTRKSPTKPNELASSRPLEWFERNVIMQVPFPLAGAMRRVYPGFLQLTGFMTMNLDRHLNAHRQLFGDLVVGYGDSVQAHRKFYDEYLAVMDLTAEYYLQTIDLVFQQHALPEGTLAIRGRRVNTGAIRDTALLTIEGELDDISGIGQTQAAHDLLYNVPDSRHEDYVQDGVGHYGVFNGSRWRAEIAPRIRRFIESNR